MTTPTSPTLAEHAAEVADQTGPDPDANNDYYAQGFNDAVERIAAVLHADPRLAAAQAVVEALDALTDAVCDEVDMGGCSQRLGGAINDAHRALRAVRLDAAGKERP